jgi:hypothetical protein
VLPLKRRAHRMSEMYGPGDPTKITGRALSKKDVVLRPSRFVKLLCLLRGNGASFPSVSLTVRPKK